MQLSIPRRRLWLAAAALAITRPAWAARPVRTAWPRRKPTPALQLTLLDGTAWTLAECLGHPVLLNFWASWCGPCVEELPALARLAEREAHDGLRILAVNYREEPDAVQRFLARSPVALDVALDRDGAAAKAFDAHVFPTTVAIGADGRVRFVAMGECDWSAQPGRAWLEELVQSRR